MERKIFEKLVKEITQNAHQHGHYIIWEEKLPDQSMNPAEAIALIHSELSEALEYYRDNNKEKFAIEIIDVIIRCLHLCGDLNIDVDLFLKHKMGINKNRPYKHGRVNL